MLFLEFLPHPLGRLHMECFGIANLVFDQFKVGPATTGQNCFGGQRVLRRRLPYELWHALHLGTYAVVGFAIVHQTVENPISQPATWAKVYWVLLWTVTVPVWSS